MAIAEVKGIRLQRKIEKSKSFSQQNWLEAASNNTHIIIFTTWQDSGARRRRQQRCQTNWKSFRYPRQFYPTPHFQTEHTNTARSNKCNHFIISSSLVWWFQARKLYKLSQMSRTTRDNLVNLTNYFAKSLYFNQCYIPFTWWT